MRGIAILLTGALVFFAFSCGGCVCPNRITAFEHPDDKDADLIRTTYNAVDCLQKMQRFPLVDPNRRILVADVVNLDNLDSTSAFGRLVAELLSARLTHRGYSVVHTTVRRGSVVITPDGEFLLSRDMKVLAENYNAMAVLVSTYTIASDKVYLSVKLVNVPTCEMVAAVDYAMPLGPRTTALLQQAQRRAQPARGAIDYLDRGR